MTNAGNQSTGDLRRPQAAMSTTRVPIAWALLFAAAILGVNLALAASVPADKDSDEFTLVLARGALAHPPGFPLYTLLGHPFVLALHALGASWAFAANAWSALGGAVAAFLGLLLADRLCGERTRLPSSGRFAVAATAALLLLLHPMVTVETTQAEVYAWHLAWVFGSSLLFVCTLEDLEREREGAPVNRTRLAACFGLVAGLGAAHHSTSVLVLLPTLLTLGWQVSTAPGKRLGPLAAGLGAACVPLVAYVVLFWRARTPDPAHWIMFEPTFEGILRHLRASQYSGSFGGFAPSEIQSEFLARWIYPWIGGALLMLVVSAFKANSRRERLTLWTLLAAAVANLAFAFSLNLSDPVPYFLPALGLALVGSAPTAARMLARLPAPSARLAGALLVLTGWATGGWWFRVGLERKQAFVQADTLIRDMWKSLPPGPGFVFWEDDMYLRLRAFQLLDREHPELAIWNAAALDAPVGRAKFTALHGIDPLAGLDDERRNSFAGSVSEYLRWIRANVNRQTDLPVYEFDPRGRSLRRLKKAEPPAPPR
ncbi:MAG: DUF2723 domain-containing protein [Planctomycetes bacterium]|nr:DUF2723 domain-containing protein [Planctomycetota bacterium]